MLRVICTILHHKIGKNLVGSSEEKPFDSWKLFESLSDIRCIPKFYFERSLMMAYLYCQKRVCQHKVEKSPQPVNPLLPSWPFVLASPPGEIEFQKFTRAPFRRHWMMDMCPFRSGNEICSYKDSVLNLNDPSSHPSVASANIRKWGKQLAPLKM
jgi:hypothetical protein